MRLKSAQENILRINDIIAELKQRVEPLKIQAEKAQKFIALTEERKKLEVSVWVTQLDEFRQKLENLDEKVLISRSEYENTENDIVDEEEKLRKSYRNMQECTIKSDEIRRKMIAEEQESSQRKSDIAVYENDIGHCHEAIEKAEKSIRKAEQTRHEYRNTIKKLENKIANLEEQKNKLKIQINEAEFKSGSAEEKNLQLGREAEKFNNEINSLHIRYNELKFTAESAEKTVADEKIKLEELLSGSNDIKRNIAEYNERISENHVLLENNCARIEELKNKISGLEMLYNSRNIHRFAISSFSTIIFCIEPPSEVSTATEYCFSTRIFCATVPKTPLILPCFEAFSTCFTLPAKPSILFSRSFKIFRFC